MEKSFTLRSHIITNAFNNAIINVGIKSPKEIKNQLYKRPINCEDDQCGPQLKCNKLCSLLGKYCGKSNSLNLLTLVIMLFNEFLT